MLNNIPLEMRQFVQWVCWRYEDIESKKPTKVPYSAITGKLASVTDANTWTTYDNAKAAFEQTGWYDGIGFVLTHADPYAFIDLDEPQDQLQLDRQIAIYNDFNSYSERSPSGKGLHVIVKGVIPSGRRRSSIEIYSSERYMTMTGNVYRDAPINNYNDLLNALYIQMSEGKKADIFYAGLEAAKLTDEKVLQLASNATNSEKFNDLYYAGNWQKEYPSQSEADFALIDIIAFYSENRQQVQRLFLQSALGQREKSRAQYRINYMLDRCFDRMLPPVDIDSLKNQLGDVIAENMRKQQENAPSLITEHFQAEYKTDSPIIENSKFSVPPGLVGEIAQFIYAQSPRPVAELALAGALGLMAGIVGRSYNISGTGLNQFVLMLAPTGTGKESVSSGIDKLIASVIPAVPSAVDFIGPSEIASSQAIHKYMSRGANSFVSMVGEFGLYLQQMGSINAAPHMVGLRRFLLDVYNKSGEGKVVRQSIYSDKDKNTNAMLSPAFSILGDSTPEKFYEGIHEGLITEGLIPRFTIIEYKGKRPSLNEAHTTVKPSFQLIEKFSSLCANSLMLNSQNKAVHVQQNLEAETILKSFDKHCDLQVNSSDRDVQRQLWSRGHMKALKMAGLIATGCNPYDPCINAEIATWSINLVSTDIKALLGLFNKGEIGVDNDETKQLLKVIETCRDFVITPWSEVSKYTGDGLSQLHGDKIIPYAFIQRKLASVATFRKDRTGSTNAIKRALKTLCERGDLQEVGKATLSKDYNKTLLAYAVANPKALGL